MNLTLFVLLGQRFTSDNPCNIECILDPNDLDATRGEPVKMDTLVINADIIRVIKMLHEIKPGWGDECDETVDEYFHPQNLTLSAHSALSMSIN